MMAYSHGWAMVALVGTHRLQWVSSFPKIRISLARDGGVGWGGVRFSAADYICISGLGDLPHCPQTFIGPLPLEPAGDFRHHTLCAHCQPYLQVRSITNLYTFVNTSFQLARLFGHFSPIKTALVAVIL